MAYRVTAPYVTVRVHMAQGGETVLGFYEGGVLPESAIEENVDALLAKGLIEETDAPTPEEQAADDAEAEKKAQENAKKAAEEVAADEAKKAEKRQQAQKAAQEKLTGDVTYGEAVDVELPVAEDRPPAASAPKAAWVDYAVSQRDEGVSEGDARAEAESYSKNDLINQYGG